MHDNQHRKYAGKPYKNIVQRSTNNMPFITGQAKGDHIEKHG
jgi:hypothetical protein